MLAHYEPKSFRKSAHDTVSMDPGTESSITQTQGAYGRAMLLAYQRKEVPEAA
jgi:hypothetical protein